jgi:hypothetical protein
MSLNEESRKPAPNPLAKALRGGIANYYTALIARNGRKTAIDECGAHPRCNRQNFRRRDDVSRCDRTAQQREGALRDAHDELDKRALGREDTRRLRYFQTTRELRCLTLPIRPQFKTFRLGST